MKHTGLGADDHPASSYPWIVNGRPVGWAFQATRSMRVSGYFRVQTQRVGIVNVNEPLRDFPIEVDVYALCVRR